MSPGPQSKKGDLQSLTEEYGYNNGKESTSYGSGYNQVGSRMSGMLSLSRRESTPVVAVQEAVFGIKRKESEDHSSSSNINVADLSSHESFRSNSTEPIYDSDIMGQYNQDDICLVEPSRHCGPSKYTSKGMYEQKSHAHSSPKSPSKKGARKKLIEVNSPNLVPVSKSSPVHDQPHSAQS